MWCVRNDAPNVFKFSSFFRYIDRHELFFFLVCAWCVLKQLFTSIPVTVMVIYFAAPWLSKKYLSTSISANNCLLSWWLLDLAVYEDKPFYSWARNSHSERKKILLFPSTIQNWISFPQIFLSSQTWRMYKKRTWWRRLQPHPGGVLLYPRGGGGVDRYPCDPRLWVCTGRGHGDTYCGPT